jgi:antagonist of KipI
VSRAGTLVVEAPGLLTTVQDRGRGGFQHLGVGPGGPMDPLSHALANLLVGNGPDAAALELTLVGPVLRFDAHALVALCGADLSATVEGEPLPLWRPVWIRAGARIAFGAPLRGARATLAVAGGLAVPAVLGSRSTHLAGGFGGWQGRPLRTGDVLPLGPAPGPPSGPPCPALLRTLLRGDRPLAPLPWFAPWYREVSFARPAVLRLVPGPRWPELEPASLAALLEGGLRVDPRSDRMGLRLRRPEDGPGLALAGPREERSGPVATGTLQLPPGGEAILLMADRQTTGGYPRLGEVAAVDLPAAAQLGPREALRFRLVTAAGAQALLLERNARLEDLAGRVAERLARS